MKKKSRKENKVKELLLKAFTCKSSILLRIAFSILCLYVIFSTINYLQFIKDKEISCLRHKFSNDYCRCYAEQSGKFYFKYLGKKLHNVAHKNCISLFDGNDNKDSRFVSPEEMKNMQDNFKKSFMDNCLRTSGKRKEYCECGLNETLSSMTEEKWKIFYFGENENSSEDDKIKYKKFLPVYLSDVIAGSKKCLKKFPRKIK